MADQELPKRCVDARRGRSLIPGQDMFEKMRAARGLVDEMQACKESSELIEYEPGREWRFPSPARA